jgi:hypothetical protein
MYKIDKENNCINPIKQISFAEAGFKERQHLQEWIAKNPSSLGEDLLIIQKEFAGFDDTNERLDLLAIDKKGNLVIIENKLDDTGKDVTWQSLKYVSYCSSLSSQNIEDIYASYLEKHGISGNAKENLSDFFNEEEYFEILNLGNSQRIILVAGSYRKEVTSTVMWLLNKGIDIKCFTATPFVFNDDYLIDIKQIIPVKETEDYIIKLAEKQQEEVQNQKTRGVRFDVRHNFWKKFLNAGETKSHLLDNLSPTTENWLGIGLGKIGITLDLNIGRKYTRTKIQINRGDKELNKYTFDFLYKHKESIETEIGYALDWNRKDEGIISSIDDETDVFNLFNEEDHEGIIKFLNSSLEKMYPTFKKYISTLDR